MNKKQKDDQALNIKNEELQNDRDSSFQQQFIFNLAKQEMKKDSSDANPKAKTNQSKDRLENLLQTNQIQLINMNDDQNKITKPYSKNVNEQPNSTEQQQFEHFIESSTDIIQHVKIQDYALNKMHQAKSPKSCNDIIRQNSDQMETKDNFNQSSLLQMPHQNFKSTQESPQNIQAQRATYNFSNKDYITEKNDQINSLSQIKIKDHNQQTEFSNIPQSDLEPNKKKELLTKEFEILLKRDTNLKMTFKFFLNKLTCGKFFNNEQVRLIKKANKQMKKDLDIFILLNRLKELEKFKALFLEKDQEILFNFFPKPVISIHHNNWKTISRAEMTEKVKKRNREQSFDTSNQSPNKYAKQNMKRVSIFKDNTQKKSYQKRLDIQQRLLNQGLNTFNSIATYEQLYNAFISIFSQGNSRYIFLVYSFIFKHTLLQIINRFNLKLVELLGKEMNDIFYRIGRPRSISYNKDLNNSFINPDINELTPIQFQQSISKQIIEGNNYYRPKQQSLSKKYPSNFSDVYNSQIS